MGRRNNSQVIGYRYLFGIHMGISRGPVNELVQIKVGGKNAWFGSVKDNTALFISQPDLFGGDDGEGGIRGTLTVMMGGPTQTAPSTLATVLKTPMPGFRRMFTAFFDGMVTAINPYPKKWEFRARRTTAGWDGAPWYPEKATISIVRETTQGETEQSGEAQNVSDANAVLVFETSPGVFTAGVNPTGLVTSIDSVYMRVYDGTTIPFAETADYTVDENFIQFTEAGIVRAGGPLQITEQEFVIEYTYDLNTTNPNAEPGTGLIQAMNPAHIVYECYTNREWGRGLPSSAFDDENWRAVADKLFAERFGLCIRWTRTDSIQSFIQVILDHVGAVVYPDRTTGKIKIQLIRDDYVREALPLFDNESGLLEISEAAVSAQAQMINEVRVTYRDPISNEDRTVRANNIASVQAAGGVTNSSTKEYKGLPTSELASRVAKRELRSLSPSIRRFNITLDRRGYDVVPGGVIRVQDLARNIPDMVLRIGTVDYGSLRDGRIKVVAMQDLFGLPTRGFTTIGPPQWTPPNSRPCVSYSEVFELPYRSVYRAFSPADFSFIENTDAYLGVVADAGNPLNQSFDIAVRSGAVEPEDAAPDGSYLCGLPPRIRDTQTLDVGFMVLGGGISTVGVGYGVAVASSATLDIGYEVTAAAPSGITEIAGFTSGLDNTGTLGGSFIPVSADPGSPGSAAVASSTLTITCNYNMGDGDAGFNQYGVLFSQDPSPARPPSTSWTFKATVRFNVTADDPFSSGGANALYRQYAQTSLRMEGDGVPTIEINKASGSTTAAVVVNGNTKQSGIALNTEFEVIVSSEFGEAFAPDAGIRRYFVGGTLVDTDPIPFSETLPESRLLVISAGYENGGSFVPAAGVEIRDINVTATVRDLSYVIGVAHGA